ncbi:MAG: hypothetical protein WCI67_04385 [Chloroflexales bacterium]
MVIAAYVLYAAIQIALLAFAIRLLLRDRHWLLAAFVINVFGLAYDNLAIGLGSLIGPGDTLMALSYPRYAIHALTTPLFGMIGLCLAQSAGVGWARSRAASTAFWAITLPALAWAIYTDLIALRLEPATSMGTLRYANAAASGAPIPAIIAITLLIICGGGILARARWPWLLIGALVMFATAGSAAKLGVVANLGEIALVAGIVATAQRFPRRIPH